MDFPEWVLNKLVHTTKSRRQEENRKAIGQKNQA